MPSIKISNHAKEQMEARGISEEMVLEIIANPGQIQSEGKGKQVYQSIKNFEDEGKNYLVRVFINVSKDPNIVITVYRTSRIEKYWHDEN